MRRDEGIDEPDLPERWLAVLGVEPFVHGADDQLGKRRAFVLASGKGGPYGPRLLDVLFHMAVSGFGGWTRGNRQVSGPHPPPKYPCLREPLQYVAR